MTSKFIDNGDGTTTIQFEFKFPTAKAERRIEKAARYLKQLDLVEAHVAQVIKDMATSFIFHDNQASANALAKQQAESDI